MNRNLRSPIRWAFVTAVVAFTVGCATTPNSELVKVRADYEKAIANTEVSQNAPLELHEARKAVERAEQAWDRRSDDEEAAHLAYLARRRIEIARTAAQGAQARTDAKRLTQERGEILLNARTREVGKAMQAAEAARREAEDSKRDAEKARTEAEQRAREAETARLAAEEQSREAARARGEAESAREEAQALAEEQRRLREALADLEAQQTDRGMVLTLGDVLFAFDRSDLQPGGMQALQRLVRFLQEYPDRELLIEGHTDSVGSANYNVELSQRRAEAVRGFLERQGVPPERALASGLGKEYPVAPNETAEGRQRNRRVEVVILEPGQHAADHQRRPSVSAGP